MNWNIVKGNWKQIKGTIKGQWGKLTNNRLGQISGKGDEWAGKVQKTYGTTQDEADKRAKRFE